MESVYKIKFFPESGERYSSEDFIDGIPNVNEKARIEFVLGLLSDHVQMDWGHITVVDNVEDHIQITAGPHRLYCMVVGKLLVVYYVCRKKSQKAKSQDIDRATRNRNKYFEEER